MDNPSDLPIVNGLDIGIIVLLLLSGFLAYARGLVHEVLSVAGWIGAIFATIYGFPLLKPFARLVTEIEIVADFGAGVVIFVVSLILLSLVTRRISKKVKDSALNAVDRSLGFLFGLLRGALICVIAYIGLGMVYPDDDQPEWILQARSMELLRPGAAMLTNLIPENFTVGGDEKEAGGGEKEDQPQDRSNKRRVVQDLLAPKPKSKNGDDVLGYGQKERQQMEQLHESIKDR
ncbi:MAG: CvpA family protein [Rhodospirillales bacterium]